MRRSIPVQNLLYNFLFPRPTPSDPPNFSHHLTRNLVPEIRIETAQFYGGLEETEARYPGLDYTFRPHVRRLSFFPHHARLFRAIKILGITDREVLDLARWEGTLWAKQRFEKDEGVKVVDTTGDSIGCWLDPRRMTTIEGRGVHLSEMAAVMTPEEHPLDHQHPPAGICEAEERVSDSARPGDLNSTSVSSIGSAAHESVPDSSLVRLETVRDLRSIRRHEPQRSTQPRSQLQSGTHSIPPLQSRDTQRTVALPSGLETALQELIDSWHALQTSRGLSDDDMSRFRADIFQRVAQLQTDVPATINIATALQMYLEQRLGTEPRALNSGHTQSQTNQVISQPAA